MIKWRVLCWWGGSACKGTFLKARETQFHFLRTTVKTSRICALISTHKSWHRHAHTCTQLYTYTEKYTWTQTQWELKLIVKTGQHSLHIKIFQQSTYKQNYPVEKKVMYYGLNIVLWATIYMRNFFWDPERDNGL